MAGSLRGNRSLHYVGLVDRVMIDRWIAFSSARKQSRVFAPAWREH